MRKQLYVIAAVFVGTGLTLGGQQTAPAAPPVAPGQGTAAPASATNLGSERTAIRCGARSRPVMSRTTTRPRSRPSRCRIRSFWPTASRSATVRPGSSSVAPRFADVQDRDLRPHAGEGAGRDLAGRRDGCEGARRRRGHEEDRRDDRERTGCAADHADALYARCREEARARHPAGELRRRSAAITAGTGPWRRWFSDRPARGRRDHQPWMGYATVGYQDIEPDRLNTFTQGVIGRTLAPGQEQPAPG